MVIRGKKKWFSRSGSRCTNFIHRSCEHVQQPQNHNSGSKHKRTSFVCVRACAYLSVCLFVCWVSFTHDGHQLWDYFLFISKIKIIYSNWMYYVTHSLHLYVFFVLSVASGSFGCALCRALFCSDVCMPVYVYAFHLFYVQFDLGYLVGWDALMMRLSQECAIQTKMNRYVHYTIHTHIAQ